MDNLNCVIGKKCSFRDECSGSQTNIHCHICRGNLIEFEVILEGDLRPRIARCSCNRCKKFAWIPPVQSLRNVRLVGAYINRVYYRDASSIESRLMYEYTKPSNERGVNTE